MQERQYNTRTIGSEAEDMAIEHLKSKGFGLIGRNYHYGRHGEIDLICTDGDIIVFVEVRSRSGTLFGPPEASIGRTKAERLRKTAHAYLYRNRLYGRECRFDFIGIDFTHKPPVIRHLINAF
jgi:putative endonuclease